MQKIIFKTICAFVPSKKKRQYLRSYLYNYSFIALINSFLFPLSFRQKLLSKKLDKLFSDSFVVATAQGLTDQLNMFLTAYRLNQQTNNKYKFLFFTSKPDEEKEKNFIQKLIFFLKSLFKEKEKKYKGNRDCVLKNFNLKKYLNYEEMEIPDEIIKLYIKYKCCIGFGSKYWEAYLPYNSSKIKPPLLIIKYATINGNINSKNYSELTDMMKLVVPLNSANEQKLKQIKQTKNSVCLHIRLGDVLSSVPLMYQPVKLSYIKKSILKMIEKIGTDEQITFFVFSNSPDLVKARLNEIEIPNISFDFVDINKDEEPHFELELMKNCQHFILTQGGFSKLASALGEYKDKIVILTTSEADIVKNQKEKEREWGYEWNDETNDWRDIKILHLKNKN